MGYNAARNGVLLPEVVIEAVYFTPLLPGADGTGDYHVNLHICFFSIGVGDLSKAAGEKIASSLTKDLSDVPKFCSILSHHNIASAAPPEKEWLVEYKDRETQQFHKTVGFDAGGNFGDVDHKLVGLVHPDWVAMSVDEDPRTGAVSSFHGDTLKREWRTEFEKSADVATELDFINSLANFYAGPYALLIGAFNTFLADKLVDELIAVNQRHFLAGTRSWRVGYDDASRAFFLETMAVERFSHLLYEKPNGHAFDYRDGIKRTWSHLLNNYINLTKYKCHDFVAAKPPARASQPARPPYDANWANYDTAKEINPHIRFRASSYQSVADIRTSPDALWVREAIKNHPGLQRHVKQQA